MANFCGKGQCAVGIAMYTDGIKTDRDQVSFDAGDFAAVQGTEQPWNNPVGFMQHAVWQRARYQLPMAIIRPVRKKLADDGDSCFPSGLLCGRLPQYHQRQALLLGDCGQQAGGVGLDADR